MLYRTFEEFCDNRSDKILSDLEHETESLNLPKCITNHLFTVLI